MNEKSHNECLHMPTILAFLSQHNRAYSTLNRQLEVIIIEISVVQVLKLRTNQWQVHATKYLLPTKVTYSHTGFHNSQASYFNLKVFVFAEL